MIVTADWVVPVARPPIRNGAIVMRHGRIAEVGPAADILERVKDAEVKRLEGCIMAPGLVNAHVHLALTSLGGLVERGDMADWLQRLVVHMQALSPSDLADSAAFGATRCIASGTTVVGDIAYGPESPAAASDAGLGGVFFWEVLGITPSELVDYLIEREYPVDDVAPTGRIRCGLSPHSAYTCGPVLLENVRRICAGQGTAFALRVAESQAERELLTRGEGPLAPLADRLTRGFKPPRHTTVEYLDALGILDGTIAFHCTTVDRSDAIRLAMKAAGAVMCPRSNEYMSNGEPPVEMLRRTGVPLGLGTDSAASNEDVDMFAEARALMRIAPSLTPNNVLRIATLLGAEVLGVSDLYGSLEVGKQADLIGIRAPSTEDPVSTLLQVGGEPTVTAVMSAGVWRVLDGKPAFDVGALERASGRVARKAADAAAGL